MTVGEDIQGALEDEQVNQDSFDQAYQQLSKNAYLDVANRIVIQKNDITAALQSAIEQQSSYGNDEIVNSLEQMLDYINSSTSTFENDYAKVVPSTTANQEADLEAIQILRHALSSDLSAVNQIIDNDQQSLDVQEENAILYINNNSALFLAQGDNLPAVTDGTIATIFSIDESHGCYYINAGEYSGVAVGNVYGITDSQGQYIGNLKIIRTVKNYSVGILINTDNVPLNSKIPNLYTRTIAPASSN